MIKNNKTKIYQALIVTQVLYIPVYVLLLPEVDTGGAILCMYLFNIILLGFVLMVCIDE